MLIWFLFKLSFGVAAQEWVIDKVDAIVARTCESCPGSVAESYIVTPVQDHVGYPKEKISVYGCHATLIRSNQVMLAAHCLRPLLRDDWKKLSGGDCSRSVGFYFPQTASEPRQNARCLNILSPLYEKSGVPQNEPDHLIVELDRHILRPQASWNEKALKLNESYWIWGYDSSLKSFVKRTCQALKAPSVLTPLSFSNKGAYRTLTCDGDLEQGWSGAAVMDVDGEIRGVVSFGYDSSGFGPASFGKNEVSVSLSHCFSATVRNDDCFTDEVTKLKNLIHVYALAIDDAFFWQAKTVTALEKSFQGLRFEYQKYPESPVDGFQSPGFKAICATPDLKQQQKEVVLFAVGQLDSLNTNYFLFNEDSTPKGVIEKPVNGLTGTFSLPFEFIKGSASKLPDCSKLK